MIAPELAQQPQEQVPARGSRGEIEAIEHTPLLSRSVGKGKRSAETNFAAPGEAGADAPRLSVGRAAARTGTCAVAYIPRRPRDCAR